MSVVDQTDAVALGVFTAWMQNGSDALRQRLKGLENVNPDERERIDEELTLANNSFGAIGSILQEAMAEALLAMPMGQWELFYQGYCQWLTNKPYAKQLGNQLEENCRGVMLMALANRCKTLQRRIDCQPFVK